MPLSDNDLKQLTEEKIDALSPENHLALTLRLLADLRNMRDRLNQTPKNSSKPPSSQPPWEKSSIDDTPVDDEMSVNDEDPVLIESEKKALADEAETDKTPKANKKTTKPPLDESPKKPGKQPGAPGYGRQFGKDMAIDQCQQYHPSRCVICNRALPESALSQAYTARIEIEIEPGTAVMPGMKVTKTKHTYFERQCACGHLNRSEPGRCGEEAGWTVSLTEWHMAGPNLVSFISGLSLRMRLSRPRIHELLWDWLGLYVSTGTINQCIHEAGRALEPVVMNEILEDIRQAELLHADETGWPQQTKALWLWVFTCTAATLFVIGRRTREMVISVLGETFNGWLISDGYCVYRDYTLRQRCIAHLLRKAQGLKDSLDPHAGAFGNEVYRLLKMLIDEVYVAREKPPDIALSEQHANRLDQFWELCWYYWDCEHEKTKALAREFINDWVAIWAVLDYPQLPLTNNEAERALRHWVISRRISYGTRTDEGSHAFCLLASVIETCRLRNASPWKYIANVIRQRRKGMPAPALPEVPPQLDDGFLIAA